MIVCVLGMHKSGTTLVSEMLHHGGVHMADVPEELGYDDSNKYERHETQRLNRALLQPILVPSVKGWRRRNGGLDRAGYEVNLDSLAWIRRGRLGALDRHPDAVEPSIDRQIVDLVADLGDRHQQWGFKDPRTCLTYQVWRHRLPPHRLVAVYRPFGEVMRRYRTSWRTPVRARRVARNWLIHNEMILAHLRRADDFVVVRYDQMMSDDEELARLRRYLDVPLRDRRDPSMYRARSTTADAVPWVASTPGLRRRVEQVERAIEALRTS